MPITKSSLKTRQFVRTEYDCVLNHDCIDQLDENGKFVRVQDGDYETLTSRLIEIETFVTEVLLSQAPAFELVANQHGIERLLERPLSSYFRQLDALTRIHLDGYAPSEYVRLFFTCWGELRLGAEAFQHPRGYSTIAGKEPFERFNDFINLLRQTAKSPTFRRQLSRRKESSARQQRTGERLIERLYDHPHSKLLVLRIDFSYEAHLAACVPPEIAKRDIGRFFELVQRRKSLGRGFLGYEWKLEWTRRKGCHFHTIIFYDGQKRQQDVVLGKALGKAWRLSVNNTGIYWNCNAHKADYRHLGIGMIHRANAEMRTNLTRYVLGYLIKRDQYLMAQQLRTGRCFQTSQGGK